MKRNQQINLGDRAKDTITGFSGVVISVHEYLNGCVRVGIQPEKLDKDGKIRESCVFDIEQVELVKTAKPKNKNPTGGPHNDPSRPSVPQR